MKILIIHSQYQLRGGEDAVVAQELELLKQQYMVEVLYFHNKSGWKGALQFLSSIWNITAVKKVKEKILELQPDVVHIHNWHFALGPLIFREINALRIPIVHTVHNYRLLCPSAILLNNEKLFINSLNQSFPFSAVFNKVYRSSYLQTFWLAFVVWFHKKIGTWNKIDLYLCLTEFALEIFQKSNFGVSKEQFLVKPNFTTTLAISDNVKKGEHFLFVGRLSEEKGVSVLLEAFKGTSHCLRIAGDGFLKDEVIDFIKNNPNIIYLGNLKSEEVVLELQTAQALIFPSLWYEGMPMTILEAFSCKIPVIASNLGAMSSMITNNFTGFHFETGSVEKLRDILSYFTQLTEDEKNQLRKNAYMEYKQKYTPEVQIGYLNDIYVQLFKNNYAKND